MAATTAPGKPSAVPKQSAASAAKKSAAALIQLYDEEIGSDKHCWHVHNVFGWAYDITAKFLLIAGIGLTAVAGVTAAADLLGKTIIGGIAMGAAVLTALGAAVPWDKRAADHWKLASKYQSDAFDMELEKLEFTEDPGAKKWIEKLRAHQRARQRYDIEAAFLAEIRNADAEEKREVKHRRVRARESEFPTNSL